MRFLGFLGASRLAMARQVLPAQVEEWREQWCFAGEERWQVRCDGEQALSLAQQAGTVSWQRGQGSRGALHIASLPADGWKHAVFAGQAAQVPDDASARHVLDQARLALVNALLQGLGQEPLASLDDGAPHAPGAALGSRALLHIQLGEVALYCLVDAALLDTALPALAPAALTPRKDAIGGARVRLQLSLPLAALALGDINDLSPGDVLLAQARLDQPLTLSSTQGTPLAKGYLARRQECLALQLIP